MRVDLKEAVLARVNLPELIGQYVSLTQAGREYKARCPFHEEKTPSFHVVPEKGFFHCFGCKAGGNAIDFVMRMENLEFRDALEWLARRCGIDPEEYRPRGERGGPVGGKELLFRHNEAAAEFFRAQLRGREGEVARQYLARRGVSERIATDFDLGYAPREWQALTDVLLGRGAKGAELASLGLIKPRGGEQGGPGGQGGYYDAFRNRLIFPIRNVTGRVIGFAGRALAAEDTPKYLNVSNSPLYDKSHVLYNLDRAKGHMREAGAVIVEGYMDVIGLAAAGVENAVASCGTALTEAHVRLAARYAERFFLAFDGDEAGRRAAWGAGRLFLTAGLDARVVPLPAGVDPDEFVRANPQGAWEALLADARGIVQFWLEHQLSTHAAPDPVTQRRWVAQLSPLYRQLSDALTRSMFVQEAASVLRLGAGEVSGLLSGEAPAPTPRHASPKAVLSHNMREQALMQGALPVEREVLRRLLQDEELLFTYTTLGQMEPYIDAAEWFTDPLLREAYHLLAEGTPADALMHDARWAPLCAELLAAEALADDNDQLLLRHRNFCIERQVERCEALRRAAVAAKDIDAEMEQIREIQRLKTFIVPVRSLHSAGR